MRRLTFGLAALAAAMVAVTPAIAAVPNGNGLEHVIGELTCGGETTPTFWSRREAEQRAGASIRGSTRALVLLDHLPLRLGDVVDAKTWGNKTGIAALPCPPRYYPGLPEFGIPAVTIEGTIHPLPAAAARRRAVALARRGRVRLSRPAAGPPSPLGVGSPFSFRWLASGDRPGEARETLRWGQAARAQTPADDEHRRARLVDQSAPSRHRALAAPAVGQADDHERRLRGSSEKALRSQERRGRAPPRLRARAAPRARLARGAGSRRVPRGRDRRAADGTRGFARSMQRSRPPTSRARRR